MKNRILTLTLALLASFLLATSAFAEEYGVIYDETDMLYTDELAQLGLYTMPDFRDTYNIDLRVDILTTIGIFSSLQEAAEDFYTIYDYGAGDGKNGVSLSLLVSIDDTGVTLNDWYVYAGGSSSELTTNGPWNVFPALSEIMTAENWAGDVHQDSETLTKAVAVMVEELENFVLAGGVADTIWNPTTGYVDGTVETVISADTFPTDGETIGYVTDTAGILTADERKALEQTAQDISDIYDFGVYIVTAENFRDFTDSYDVFDGATTIYRKYNMGIGEESKGVLLFLSMENRDFSLITYSDYGNFVFDTETREAMTSWFLDDFASDNWDVGFADYLSICSDILADGPNKLQNEIRGMIGIIFIFPLIVAFIAIIVLGRKMKSVAKATHAGVYAEEGLELTNSHDVFTHSTETRRKRSSESSGSGRSGGTRSRSSGGFGGTSGKF